MSLNIFSSFLVWGGGKIQIINILQIPLVRRSINKMKRCLFFLGVVLSAFLLSCSKETSLQSIGVEETIYQKFGRMHNEGLDYVLDYIKQNKGTIMTRSGQPLSKKDIISMVEPAVKEFVRVISESRQFGPCTRVSENELHFDYSGMNISDLRESLSDTGKDYLDRFVSILESHEEYNLKLSSLSGLVSEIYNDASVDQLTKESLLYAVEVGISSFKYWTGNIQDWFVALNCYDALNTRGHNWVNARGYVLNEYGQPVSMVMASIKGTYPACGTVTDGSGYYCLGINPNDIIVLTMVGYQGKEIPADAYKNGPVVTNLLPIDMPGYLYSIIEADASAALGVICTKNPEAALAAAIVASAIAGIVDLDMII